jgi:hypothetical protein
MIEFASVGVCWRCGVSECVYGEVELEKKNDGAMKWQIFFYRLLGSLSAVE